MGRHGRETPERYATLGGGKTGFSGIPLSDSDKTEVCRERVCYRKPHLKHCQRQSRLSEERYEDVTHVVKIETMLISLDRVERNKPATNGKC